MNLIEYLVDQLDGVARSLKDVNSLSDYERSYKIGELTYLVGELKKEIKKCQKTIEEIEKRRARSQAALVGVRAGVQR